MKPQVLWQTWRRILQSDALRAALMSTSDEEGRRAVAALSPEQKEVFDAYANEPASEMYVGFYRTFLFDSISSAMKLTPMSSRIFDESPLAHLEVFRAFSKHTGYRDDGPNFWRTAGDLLTFFQESYAPFTSGQARDVARLESEATKLARSLCRKEDVVWASHPALDAENASRTMRFRQRGSAIIVSTEYDLTSWIENPKGFDVREELPKDRCFWVVFFEKGQSSPTYVELSERAAELYNRLDVPHTCAELSKGMQAFDLAEDDALAIVSSLRELDIIVPA